MSLFRRTAVSMLWSMLSSSTSIIVLFVRTVILSRLIPVETFGVYTWAFSIVVLSSMVADIGIGSAFLHRTDETLDEDHAAAVHLTLKIILTVLWVIVMGTSAFFADLQTRIALWVLTATTASAQFTATPHMILVRRVVHRRLSLIDLLDNIISTVVAIVMALQGYTLSALLSSHVISACLQIIGLYVWKPVWKPHLAWDMGVMRYYLRFGRHIFASTLLVRLQDRVDDLWVGAFLGTVSLGYYSRAYSMATYPRKVLAAPIEAITGGTYAELKGKRQQLSQAFYRINALLIRTGFYLGGILAVVAPEFIRIVLSDKWMPMLNTFRLMLIFTLLAPIKNTMASMLNVGVGKPNLTLQVRVIQFVVMLVGLFLLGPQWGIEGVALVVDVMLVLGIVLLLWHTRFYVDYSLKRIFLPPTLALGFSLSFAWIGVSRFIASDNDWFMGGGKIVVFSAVYIGILLLTERKDLEKLLAYFRQNYNHRKRATAINTVSE